jgi:cobalamin-dependent methionine synthase I
LVIKHLHDRILLDGSAKLSGTLVVSHLAGAQWISAVLVTLGSDLEEASARRFDSDPILALALDGLGNAAVENIAQQVCRRVGDKAQLDSLTVSTPLSPGEAEWPVEVGQPEIHSLVDATRIGVNITAGGMMVPKKSISFVLGIGKDMSQEEPCAICSLRESCHYHG